MAATCAAESGRPSPSASAMTIPAASIAAGEATASSHDRDSVVLLQGHVAAHIPRQVVVVGCRLVCVELGDDVIERGQRVGLGQVTFDVDESRPGSAALAVVLVEQIEALDRVAVLGEEVGERELRLDLR